MTELGLGKRGYHEEGSYAVHHPRRGVPVLGGSGRLRPGLLRNARPVLRHAGIPGQPGPPVLLLFERLLSLPWRTLDDLRRRFAAESSFELSLHFLFGSNHLAAHDDGRVVRFLRAVLNESLLMPHLKRALFYYSKT